METKQIDTIVQQEIDKAVQEIVNQGGSCFAQFGENDFICSYANGEKRCVVGWLVSDPKALEDYSDKHEGLGVESILLKEEMNHLFPSWAMARVTLLSELQKFHDYGTIRARKIKLKELNRLGLDTSAPQYNQWVEMV